MLCYELKIMVRKARIFFFFWRSWGREIRTRTRLHVLLVHSTVWTPTILDPGWWPGYTKNTLCMSSNEVMLLTALWKQQSTTGMQCNVQYWNFKVMLKCIFCWIQNTVLRKEEAWMNKQLEAENNEQNLANNSEIDVTVGDVILCTCTFTYICTKPKPTNMKHLSRCSWKLLELLKSWEICCSVVKALHTNDLAGCSQEVFETQDKYVRLQIVCGQASQGNQRAATSQNWALQHLMPPPGSPKQLCWTGKLTKDYQLSLHHCECSLKT